MFRSKTDTAALLRETSYETRSLLKKLNRIIVSEDTMHEQLGESPKEFEVCDGENLHLKISLSNRVPPLTIFIKYLDDKSPDLTLYMSQEQREPNMQSHSGAFHDVSPFNLETN